ncbi:MAG: nuclear transport factor 2 family protein [Caulobacteraceae bacterium]|nr:nuclear transport factor 2 family protein [Caulobacteraceae bacterium]
MTAPVDMIRARRRLTNRLIAAHQADRLAPFLAADIRLTGGEGGMILGAPAVVEAFRQQFADPDFVTYERLSDAISLDQDGQRAAESGHWTGIWKDGEGRLVLTGPYLAVWQKRIGQWVIEQELYVTLTRTSQPGAAPRA